MTMDSQAMNHRWARVMGGLLIGLFLLSFSGPPSWAQSTSKKDVVFIIDGSGSISSSDWTLQKVGFTTAVQDTTFVPRDGTVAIGIVQFSASTRVESPLTVVNSNADITTIVNAINGMVQFASLTGPGNGIVTANTLLSAARTDAQQVYCMSTDGTTNTGTSLSTAVAAAQAAGVDRYTVVAIEDFGNGASLRSHYSPHVFGGGTFSLAVNTTEFANLVGVGCLTPPDPVDLIAVEVNQASQSWKNTVDVIQNKTTYVRVFVQPKTATPVVVKARLRGFRSGSELSGSPLTALNPGGQVTAQQNTASRRGTLGESLYFRLPTSWLTGDVTLTAERVGGTFDCLDAAPPTANDCSATVTFVSTKTPQVKFVRVQWTDTSGNTHQPTSAQVVELARRMRAIYPVANVSWTTGQMTLSGTWNLATNAVQDNFIDTILSQLTTRRILDLCFSFFGCDTLYYGVTVDAPVGGMAKGIPSTVSMGDMPRTAFQYGRNRHAHEVAHSLGTVHAPYCGAVTGAAIPLAYNTAVVGGRTVATLGPENLTENDRVWGLDSMNPQPRVYDPLQTFEMMSYCGGTDARGTFRWISELTYEHVRSKTNALNFDAPLMVTQAGQEFLLIRGTINTTNNTVAFAPFQKLESSQTLPAPEPGDYILRVFNSSGAQIGADISFKPNPLERDVNQPGTTDSSPGLAQFAITVAVSTPIAKAEILKTVPGTKAQTDATSLGSVSASSNAPTVAVTYPNGGETLVGDEVILRWSASDADGDTLTYSVQFSADSGTTWTTLATDVTKKTFLQIPMSQLQTTTTGLIRVTASDGFNSTTDASNAVFTVDNNPPTVTITGPSAGDLFSGVQTISFDGIAIDPKDGQLSGTSLQWSSSLDGALGSGTTLGKTADTLTEGNHTITLTATNSGGKSGKATVNITVVRVLSSSLGVNAVTPSTGSTAGGTSVTITGTNFSGTPTVTFGGTAATGVTLVDQNKITAVTPAGSAGTVNVVVSDGTNSATLTGGFTYFAPPTVTTIPRSGGLTGTQTITIVGSGFVTGQTTVMFGTIELPSSSVTVVSSTELLVTLPKRLPGRATVTITTPGGTITLDDGFNFYDSTVGQTSLVAAVLPSSRSVQVGTTATVFVTLINTGSTDAQNVTIGLKTSSGDILPTSQATTSFATTNSTSNAVTGTADTPVNILAGESQSFVLAITPTAAFDSTEVELSFSGVNTSAVTTIPGVNTLLLSASNTPIPDIVASAAITSNDGIVNVPGVGGTGAFAVATVNVGASATIIASADDGGARLPVEISLCETNPSTGQCTSSLASSVTTTINANATPTFSIFVKATQAISLDAARKRIFVRFKDQSGVTRGSTSVAVRTQ